MHHIGPITAVYALITPILVANQANIAQISTFHTLSAYSAFSAILAHVAPLAADCALIAAYFGSPKVL